MPVYARKQQLETPQLEINVCRTKLAAQTQSEHRTEQKKPAWGTVGGNKKFDYN